MKWLNNKVSMKKQVWKSVRNILQRRLTKKEKINVSEDELK
jgi:hypothetical protein